MTNIETVTRIVEEETGRRAAYLADKPHAEQKASRMACCWSSPIVKDGFEIAVCQPSIQSKGDTYMAFFTFERLK